MAIPDLVSLVLKPHKRGPGPKASWPGKAVADVGPIRAKLEIEGRARDPRHVQSGGRHQASWLQPAHERPVCARSGRLPAGSWAEQTRKTPSRADLQQVGIFAEESLGRYSTHAFVIDHSDHPAANDTRDLASPLHRVAQLGDAANRLDQDTARDREINRCHFLIQQNQGSATI